MDALTAIIVLIVIMIFTALIGGSLGLIAHKVNRTPEVCNNILGFTMFAEFIIGAFLMIVILDSAG